MIRGTRKVLIMNGIVAWTARNTVAGSGRMDTVEASGRLRGRLVERVLFVQVVGMVLTAFRLHALPAFPGAEGFGSTTGGGRGGGYHDGHRGSRRCRVLFSEAFTRKGSSRRGRTSVRPEGEERACGDTVRRVRRELWRDRISRARGVRCRTGISKRVFVPTNDMHLRSRLRIRNHPRGPSQRKGDP